MSTEKEGPCSNEHGPCCKQTTDRFIPFRVYNLVMNTIAEFIKQKRKEAGLTQEEFALHSGLGLRFVRELEQGKETVRMDKVNQALAMFGMKAVPGRKDEN